MSVLLVEVTHCIRATLGRECERLEFSENSSEGSMSWWCRTGTAYRRVTLSTNFFVSPNPVRSLSRLVCLFLGFEHVRDLDSPVGFVNVVPSVRDSD